MASEQAITKTITAVGIRLRFDKVALRLLQDVKASLGKSLLPDQSVIFTVTAPIKLPGKTSAALQGWLSDLPVGEYRTTINGNDVRARRVKTLAAGTARVLGFVHNPESDAGLILNLAESSLSGR